MSQCTPNKRGYELAYIAHKRDGRPKPLASNYNLQPSEAAAIRSQVDAQPHHPRPQH